MLLRHITKHVKDQNWFAVLLDFFIVVVGILIAFQINSWAEGQADKRSLHIALQRLNDEIQSNLVKIDSVSAQHAKIATAGKDLLEAVRSPELKTVPMELIGPVFLDAFTTDYSTGALTYILDQQSFHGAESSELRRVISALPAEYQDALEDEELVFQILDTHWNPYISQYLPVESFWNRVYEERGWGAFFTPAIEATKSNPNFISEFKQIASTLRFQNEIVNRIGYQALVLNEQDELRSILENVSALIEEEIR